MNNFKPWEVPTSSLGAGCIIQFDNKILLVQINYGLGKGFWILPGGKVDAHEWINDASAREVLEETNITIDEQKLVGFRQRIFNTGRVDIYFIYSSKLSKNPNLKWPEEEIIKAQFWDLSDIFTSEFIRPLTKKMIESVVNKTQIHFEEFKWSDDFKDRLCIF